MSIDRFEHLHSLTRDQRPPQPPHQLLALAGEHAAGDHLDLPGERVVPSRHRESFLSDFPPVDSPPHPL